MRNFRSKLYLFASIASFLVFLLFVAFIINNKQSDGSVSVSSQNEILFSGDYYPTLNYDQPEQAIYNKVVDISEGSIDLVSSNKTHIVGNSPVIFSSNRADALEILTGTVYVETQNVTAIRLGSSNAFFLEPDSSAIIDSELRSIIILKGFGSFAADKPVIKGEAVRWEVDQFNIVDFDKNQYIENSDLYNTFYLLYQINKLPVEYRYVIDQKTL